MSSAVACTRSTGLALVLMASMACGSRACATSPQRAPEASPATHPSTGSAAQPAISETPPAGQLDVVFRAAQALESELPTESFDPRAISRAAGEDPAKILDWVTRRTALVPYQGALRGPVGVLMDRVGNSVDRSLLLAELLRCSRFTVRLARSRLSVEQARTLVPLLDHAPAPAGVTPSLVDGHADREIDRLARAFEVDPAQLRAGVRAATAHNQRLVSQLATRIAAQTTFLADAVGEPAAAGDVDRRVLDALSDHWWVQYERDGRWVDLDPVLAAAGRSVQPQAEHTYPFDQPDGRIPLPSEVVHEITIRVIVEQHTAGRLAEKTALEHRFRPAEVLGQPIVLRHVPLNWPSDAVLLQDANPAGAVMTAALEQNEWLPALAIGTTTVHQLSVDDAGELSDRPGQKRAAASGPGAALGTFDALSGADEPASAPSHFTAEWIEYRLHVPGKDAEVFRRAVFDLLGSRRASPSAADPAPDARDRARRALSLLGRVEILPLVCRLSRPWVAARMLEQLRVNREAISASSVKGREGDTTGALGDAARIVPFSRRLFDVALKRFEWNPIARHAYLDAPNILTFRGELVDGGAAGLVLRQGFDIVANRVATRPHTDVDPFHVRLTQGIADTNVEGLLLEGEPIGNAGTLLGAQPRADQWITIRTAEDLASGADRWPPELVGRVTQLVRAGRVVVAPRRVGEPPGGRWAFWVVAPDTGDTMGVGDLGWGQATMEGALVLSGGLVLYSGFMMTCLEAIPRNAPINHGALYYCFSPWLTPGNVGVVLAWVDVFYEPPPPPPYQPPPPPERFGSGRRR